MEIHIKKILSKKHLLLVGGSKSERQSVVTKIIENTNYETFRFPKGMKLIDEYIDFVRKNKLYNPWYKAKGKYGDDQILDFHNDWISENHSLIVIEEIQMMEERWKIELIKWYLEEVEYHRKGENFIHLLISQNKENGLIEKLSESFHIKKLRNRTRKQIIESCLNKIDISTWKISVK